MTGVGFCTGEGERYDIYWTVFIGFIRYGINVCVCVYNNCIYIYIYIYGWTIVYGLVRRLLAPPYKTIHNLPSSIPLSFFNIRGTHHPDQLYTSRF